MNKTNIEWVKNPDGTQGYTWNPITGCLNGCEYCYARKLANGRLKSRYLANHHTGATEDMTFGEIVGSEQDPFYPRFWEGRLNDPELEIRKPRGIFAVDMGELFAPWIPQVWTRDIMNAIKIYYWHRFYTLTNQPQELIKWPPFPDNCWVGVTATDVLKAYEAVAYLENIKARVKYLSIEPLLYGGVIVTGGLPVTWDMVRFKSLNQVIIGAQTRPYRPPKMKWIDDIVNACDRAGIPVFLKDNLQPLVDEVFKGATNYWSPLLTGRDHKLRQEFPR